MKRLAYSDNEEENDRRELAENLARCRELLARLGGSSGGHYPDSFAERHLQQYGHRFGRGCCIGMRDAA